MNDITYTTKEIANLVDLGEENYQGGGESKGSLTAADQLIQIVKDLEAELLDLENENEELVDAHRQEVTDHVETAAKLAMAEAMLLELWGVAEGNLDYSLDELENDNIDGNLPDIAEYIKAAQGRAATREHYEAQRAAEAKPPVTHEDRQNRQNEKVSAMIAAAGLND